MKSGKAKSLLTKYAAGQCTPEEIAVVESWYLQHEYDDNLTEDERLSDMQEIHSHLISEINRKPKPAHKLWPFIIAAASVLIFLSIGGYFLLKKQGDQQLVKIRTHDIPPGNYKAILTLTNGKQIVLSNFQNGKFLQQGKVSISKSQDGHIIYQAPENSEATNKLVYNTITTPPGGEYRVTLADGTNVWLNSASSITYPTIFNNKDRTVQITGEAYFEVAHNAAKPFRVKSNGQTVEVLGTHFNINSYADERVIKTTLLEGSVKLTTSDHVVVLLPGKQSQVSFTGNSKGIFKGIQNVDTDECIAWKNGFFQFDKADIKTVMRQIARWYDVDISYEGKINNRVFSGSIYKNLSASKALQLLSFTDVHFTIDGRKIIVSE